MSFLYFFFGFFALFHAGIFLTTAKRDLYGISPGSYVSNGYFNDCQRASNEMSTGSLRSTRRVSSLFLDRFHARLQNTNAFICGCYRLPTGLSRSAKRIHSGLNEGFNARLCGVYSQHPALSYAQGADSLDLPPDATIKLGDSLDLPPGATIKLGGQFRFYLRDATPKHGGGVEIYFAFLLFVLRTATYH